MRNVLWPAGLDIATRASGGTFTGIDGQPTPGLGIAVTPIGVGVPGATFEADMLGGAGSRCPGLFPLNAQIEWQCSTLCGLFENGDGIFHVSST